MNSHRSDSDDAPRTGTSAGSDRDDEPASSFLAVPAAARLGGLAARDEPPEDPDASTPLPADQRYQLGECLGRGGMGRVHRARDTQLDRDVALKFLDHDNPDIRRMFLREARIQARVRHPNVVDVFDSGTWDGTPFVSMRLIEGRTLAEAAEGLPLEARLRLLIQVAEGLDAAHRAGLAHRDVKPGNVLIEERADGALQAQLIDFGLAVDVAGAGGEDEPLAGSPQYIAPERFRADAVVEDRRADVYSLGITLFRVLTGALPFDERSLTEMLRAPNAPAPPLPPPRTVSPDLPPELEAIILRCAAVDPNQRYATASAVAVDLRRYLDGEVVDAYAAGLAYRLTRFVLRNRLVTALAGAAVLAVVVGSIAVGIFALRADAARERAELRQGQAEELIRFMVVDLYEKLDQLGRLDVITDVGDAAMEYFAAVPDDLMSDEERLRHSRALYQIGQARIRQGNNAAAETSLERSLGLARALVDADPLNQERLFELGQGHFWLGYVHWRQGDLTRAREEFEAYRDVSARLVDVAPDNPDWRRELADSHSNLGSLLRREGDLAAALAEFRAAQEIDAALVAAQPDDTEALSEYAASNNMVGLLLQDSGQLIEATDYLERNAAIRRQLGEREGASPREREFLATSLSDLGVNLSMRGQWDRAAELFRQSNSMLLALNLHDSDNASWTAKLAWSQILLARAALAESNLERASAHLDEAGATLERLPDQHSNVSWRRATAIVDYHRAIVHALTGDNAVAMTNIARALETLQALASELPDNRSVHRWLGQAHVVRAGLLDGADPSRQAWRAASDALHPYIILPDDPSSDPAANDLRMVLPWWIARTCLGEGQEHDWAREEIEAVGYSEPGLRLNC